MLSDMPSLVKKNDDSVTLKFTQYNSSSQLWVYDELYFDRFLTRYLSLYFKNLTQYRANLNEVKSIPTETETIAKNIF